MHERVILREALDIRDPAARAAYLERACGGDDALRARIAAALAATPDAPPVTDDRPPPQRPAEAPPAATVELPRTVRVTGDDADDDEAAEEAADTSFLAPSTRPASLGRLGHYEILQVLGRGAFGIVFKAFDEKLHRLVAIKVMNPQLAATSPPRKRFLREARSAAAVKHENVVQVYSVEEQPLPYLVMEYVAGRTLQQKLDDSGPLDVAELARLGRQMASGLAAAHAQGLIHRDVKPGNILLEDGPETTVKITDFGLARAADDASLSRSGTISGTPMYMAPEQASGGSLDHRADLFSLGSVLYQMATGRAPFRAPTAVAVLKRVTEETPRPIREIVPEVPEWFCAIVARLHAKRPDDRLSSAQEAAELLAKGAGAPAAALPKGNGARRMLVAAGAIGAVLLGAAVAELRGFTNFLRRDAANASGSAAPDRAATGSPPPPPREGWRGWPAEAPPPAIAPFDAATAKLRQEAWANYLGIPVERVNSIGVKFRLIPPGEFLMGSTAAAVEALIGADASRREWLESETPPRRVVLTQPFYLSVHEVTQGQYAAITGRNPSHFSPTGEGKALVAGRDAALHPVERTNWIEAALFCDAMSRKEGFAPSYGRLGSSATELGGDGYRLPSEAEWEFACRAGATTAFWPGDAADEVLSTAWFVQNSGARTHAVGERPANAFGLHDMHGNVAEWVGDGWAPRSLRNGEGDAAVDPRFIAPPANPQRVVRGGGWNEAPPQGRAAARPSGQGFEMLHPAVGFRIALSTESFRADLARGAPAAVPTAVTIRRLPGGHEVVTPGYRLRLTPAGSLGTLDADGVRLWEFGSLCGNKGGPENGDPPVVKLEGESLEFTYGVDYRVRYEFREREIVMKVRASRDAAARHGEEGKYYYIFQHLAFGAGPARVSRVDPPGDFAFPPPRDENLVDFTVRYSSGHELGIQSPPTEARFNVSGYGERIWSHGWLDFAADNYFQFTVRKPAAAKSK